MATDDKGDDRKAKVLHARIPEALEDELKKRAGTLGISVSNLVRNVLANTFGLVEGVVADAAELARQARGEPPTPAREPDKPPAAARPRVIGWQVVALNVNAVCDRCNALLPKGSEAAFGVTDVPGPRVVVCPACMKEEIHA